MSSDISSVVAGVDAWEDCREVIDQIRRAVLVSEAEPIEPIPYGPRFRVVMSMSGPAGSLRVLTARIYRTGEDVPRLVALHPHPQARAQRPVAGLRAAASVYARRARPDLGVRKGDFGTIVEAFDRPHRAYDVEFVKTTAPPAPKEPSPPGVGGGATREAA
jgi:hypothetical protein